MSFRLERQRSGIEESFELSIKKLEDTSTTLGMTNKQWEKYL